MADLVSQQKILEKHLEIKKSEEENEKLKERKSQENLQETKEILEKKIVELNEVQTLNAKAKEEINKKNQELNDAQTKIKDLENLKNQLKDEINKQKEQNEELKKKVFGIKNQNDINLPDKTQTNLDPKRKIVDSQPLNQPNDSKDAILKDKPISKEEDKNIVKPESVKQDQTNKKDQNSQ